MAYQIKSMESAYKGQTIYVPSMKLFDEIVYVYRNYSKQYQQLLQEAKRMAEEDSLKITTIAGGKETELKTGRKAPAD